MIIEKKTWPEAFEKVLSGEKNFDVRLADFECKEGDTLVLREYDPKTKQYTGRKIEKKISLVFRTKDQPFWKQEDAAKYGFQIMRFG